MERLNNINASAWAAAIAVVVAIAAGPASAQSSTAASTSSAAPPAKSASGAATPTRAAPKRRVLRRRVQSTSAQTDGRTGGDPVSSARTPGGPPDNVNNGLTAPLPSVGKSKE